MNMTASQPCSTCQTWVQTASALLHQLFAEAATLESLIPALPHPARELAAAQLEVLRSNRESMSAWIAGEYTDAESGSVYLRARYYDPATGQFSSSALTPWQRSLTHADKL